ncbi:MAG: hypothetical protein P8099_08960 [Gemmatimonadota bacterium]|jgi:hypothetical protein
MIRTLLGTLIPLVCLFPPTPIFAQSVPVREAYPVGLSVSYGVGAYGVRDEAISTQRYEGTLPYFAVAWTRGHEHYIYRVEMELRQSEGIRNYNVSTRITRFVLGQAFLYPLGSRPVMGHGVDFFLGPTTEAAVLMNEQHIAVDALGFAQSVASLVSLGVQADALMPVSGRFTALASVRTSVISLGVRGVDDELDDSSPVKLLTLLNGTNASLEAGAIYHLTGRLSFRLAYLFQLGRITAWHPVLDASDNVVGRLSWRF